MKKDLLLNTVKIFLAISVLVMTSCSVGPSYIPPSIDVPTGWKNHEEACERCDADLDYWWQVFEDPKLDALENLAVENNRDLYVAYERINEARALMGIAAADFYPQVFLNPQYTNTLELFKNHVSSTTTNAANTGTGCTTNGTNAATV